MKATLQVRFSKDSMTIRSLEDRVIVADIELTTEQAKALRDVLQAKFGIGIAKG
jgi:hypothetical protein